MIKLKNSKCFSVAALSFCVAGFAVFQACSKSGTGADIPLIAPPVAAATPTTLLASTTAQSRYHTMAVTIAELRSRFYTDGPTEISNLLESIDTRLAEINTRSSESTRDCLSATAVAYDISVFGETVTTYMQCYDVFSDGTGGMLFGKKDNVWYLYTNVGQQRVVAKSSPVTGADGKYEVEAWVSVGQGNSTSSTCSSSWMGCSYGVIHLKANSSTNILELTTGGTGLGFCSAHVKTDGTNLYIKGQSGSHDLSPATTWTCATVDDKCVATSDLATTGTCTSIDSTGFALTSLGVSGQTTFGNNVTITGADTDAVHFGPSVAEMQVITGVAAF